MKRVLIEAVGQSTLSQNFCSDSKGNHLNGGKIWLVGFVLVDDNILRSVVLNTELCPCPVLLCQPDYFCRTIIKASSLQGL